MSLLGFIALRLSLYAFELVLASIPFNYKKKRRSHLYLRLIPFFAVLAAIIVGLSFLGEYIFTQVDHNEAFSILHSLLGYTLIFGACFGFFVFFFDEPVSVSFGASIQALTVRMLWFCLYIILANALGSTYNFLYYPNQTVVSFLIYLGTLLLVYTVYFFAGRKVLFARDTRVPKQLIAVYSVVVVAFITINCIGEIYSRDHVALYLLLVTSETVTLLVLLIADYLLRQNAFLTDENAVISTLLSEQAHQFKFSKVNAEDLRVKAHDLKHQVAILRAGGAEAEKLLDSLSEDIDDFESSIYLDNQVLNIVLREKWAYCKKHRIRLTYQGDPQAFSNVEKVDLFTLAGNILDNAIEASMRLSDKEKRVISVNIFHKNGYSTFRCDNYYEGNLEIEEGIYRTQKKDKVLYVTDFYARKVSLFSKDA